MKTLDWYIVRKFLGTFFFALALILCIVIVFDISERLEKFLESSATVGQIIVDYYINFIPYFANMFSSLFTFISVIFFTSNMAYKSEIIAILSTGISFNRMLRPYFFSATVIALMSFVLSAFIIPNANARRNEFSEKYLRKAKVNREMNIHRRISPDTYIYMSSIDNRRKSGSNFTMETFDNDTLKGKMIAASIEWKDDIGKWRIKDWELREFDGTEQRYTTGKQIDTVLNFKFSEFTEDPKRVKETLTLPELNQYIERQILRGSTNVVEFQLEKYRIFSNAFATFILTLIGACIASKKIRGGMGFHLGLGLLLSFSYILFMQFSTVFATNGGMNPLLAVWIPNILFAVVAIFVYRMAPK